MQKWEYCLITGVAIDAAGWFDTSFPKLRFFSAGGAVQMFDLGKDAERPRGWETAPEGEYLDYVIARLGQDGWEMVSAVNTGSPDHHLHAIYFRRLLEPA